MYENKFMKLDLYNDTFDKFCALLLKQNPTLLEIACGPGNVTKYLFSKRPDFNIFGIDLAPKMIKLARKNNPQADFKTMDCRNISTLEKRFDAIMCAFVMPYLSKNESSNLIKDSSARINPSGLLYFSIMEDDYSKSGFETTSFSGTDRVYIYYHQADFISECLSENGFRIIDLLRQKYPEPDGSFLSDMIVIAQKQ